MRARWRPLVGAAAVLLSLTPVLWVCLAPISAIRGFALGAYVATVLGWLYHWAVLGSGAATVTMGQEAEVWTDQELARLGQRWRIINHVVFRKGDIDHVAVGPDGVIVIETKWTSSAVKLDGRDEWLRGAFEQARRNADDVRKVLGWGARPDRPVSPLVVVWGPQVQPATDELYRDTRGVNAIAGKHLRQTLAELGDEQRLDQAEQDRIYEKIRRHVDQRDKHDAAGHGPDRPPMDQVIADWTGRLLVGFTAFFIISQSLRLGLIGFAVAQVLGTAGAVAGIKLPVTRRFGWAWLVGAQAVTLLLLAFGIGQLLT